MKIRLNLELTSRSHELISEEIDVPDEEIIGMSDDEIGVYLQGDLDDFTANHVSTWWERVEEG